MTRQHYLWPLAAAACFADRLPPAEDSDTARATGEAHARRGVTHGG
jgi:hypothetical protein